MFFLNVFIGGLAGFALAGLHGSLIGGVIGSLAHISFQLDAISKEIKKNKSIK